MLILWDSQMISMHLGLRGEERVRNTNTIQIGISRAYEDPTADPCCRPSLWVTGHRNSPGVPQWWWGSQGDWAFLGEHFIVALLCDITFLTAETVSSKDFKRLNMSLDDPTCISLRPSQVHLQYYLVYNIFFLHSISFYREVCIYALKKKMKRGYGLGLLW